MWRRVVFAVGAGGLLACGDGGPTVEAPAPAEPAEVAVAVDPSPEPAVDVSFAESTRSLRVLRSIAVRDAPDPDAALLGTLAQDTRVRWRGAALGPGCDGLWIEIEPRGFVCDRHLEENFREPRALELPRLAGDAIVPGTYGAVDVRRARAFRNARQARTGRGGRRLTGQVAVTKRREVEAGNRTFWRVGSGELIDARFIRPYTPAYFEGVDLTEAGAPTLPLAWTRDLRHSDAGVPILGDPDRCSAPIGHLPPRIVVPVLGRSAGGTVRIGEAAWVDPAHLHIAWPTARPEKVGPNARWIDVDLEDQVLVAWSGDRPVRATLVSSGGPASPTPEGLFRIWIKFAERDMSGEVGGRPYRVEQVPWAAFFEGDFGFHAAYWHDRFGQARSSGCINLSPADARWLYFWSDPHVPAGWTMAYGAETLPGSWVRVRRGPNGADVLDDTTAVALGSSSDAP
jgi:hypothetical protein